MDSGMISSMTVAENTNSYTVTGLNGIDNYIVTVTANNSCGMMMSGPITVYGKNVHMLCISSTYKSTHICVPVATGEGPGLTPNF